MSTEFVSPIGRLVQGSMTMHQKTDMNTDKPLLDDNGQPVMENFMAIAIAKTDPGLGAFYALFVEEARKSFPHLLDSAGDITHPKFAWKIQDGDGVDTNGQSVADKPGFAGHYIFKMATRYPPRCFHAGKWDAMQQIQNPDEVIKRGYYVRVLGVISGNGVKPDNRQAVPGLFVSPNAVELVAFGEVINTGVDAAAGFGAVPLGALPAGATTAPVGGTPAGPPGLTPPPPAAAPIALPGVAAPPAVGLPGLAPPAPPAPPAAPQYTMLPSAQGATREALHAAGWTDETLIAHGHMTKNY